MMILMLQQLERTRIDCGLSKGATGDLSVTKAAAVPQRPLSVTKPLAVPISPPGEHSGAIPGLRYRPQLGDKDIRDIKSLVRGAEIEMPDLPACLDRRVKPHLLREAAHIQKRGEQMTGLLERGQQLEPTRTS